MGTPSPLQLFPTTTSSRVFWGRTPIFFYRLPPGGVLRPNKQTNKKQQLWPLLWRLPLHTTNYDREKKKNKVLPLAQCKTILYFFFVLLAYSKEFSFVKKF